MSENRLTDYLDHMQQAATDACGFVEDLTKEDFLKEPLKKSFTMRFRYDSLALT